MRAFGLLLMMTAALLVSACSGDGDTAGDGPNASVGEADAGSAADGAASGDDQGTDVGDASSEESCWWCTDASDDAEVPDTLEGSSGAGGKGDGGAILITWAGMVNLDTGEGTLGVAVADATSEAVICELTQPVVEVSDAEDCTACSFAKTLTFGEATISTGTADDCALQGVVQTSLSMGHGEDGQLYHGGKEEGWQPFGTSSFEDPIWLFNLEYALAGGGGGFDEACYEGCLDKGGSEEECEAACGGGGGKGDDDGDTIDEACFDACIDKGQSEEVCAAACASGDGGKDDGDGGK